MLRPLSALLLLLISTAPAFADGDPVEGKVVFNKCRPCHDAVREIAKVGPHLIGVVGRTAGTLEGYNYSDAIKEAGAAGLIWDEANLAAYLRDPKGMIPDGRMQFVGLKKDEDIANVIAYLKADPKP